jgi:fluoroquinolone transport system permease protein
MFHNFKALLKGELIRLSKYKILQISFVVSLIWIAIMFLIGKENIQTFVPIFIFTDAALMTVLLVGASLFYERQENTLKTLMITPSSYTSILLSKIIASIYLAMQSTIVISLVAVFAFDITIKLFWLYLFVVLIGLAHSAIGYTFTMFSRDFNGLLAAIGGYMIVFAIPSLISALGIFSEAFDNVLMISPTHAALELINYSMGSEVALWKLIFGTLYLVSISIVLYKYVVARKYAEMAVRE